MADTLTTKLGTTRAGPRTRIWLQGSRLLDHGFPPGSRFKKRWDITAHRLVLTGISQDEFESGDIPRREMGTVSGTLERPVIDITGEIVATTFEDDYVYVTFHKNRIVIEDAFEQKD